MIGNWISATNLDAFEDDRFVFKMGGLHIGLFKAEGEIFAIDNICTHGNACLTDGELEGCLIECPLHAGLVDLRTGAPAGSPITRPSRCYPVRIEDGRVFIALPGEPT